MKAIATEFRDRRQREERKHRLNREITAPEVRLSGPENEPIGIVSLQEALRMAGDLDVDLVEIAATASPPVCRLMDYGKFKYQEQKKAAEAKAKQTVIDIKEVKFRPGGTVKRGQAFKRHILTKKTTKNKRQLRGAVNVHETNLGHMAQMLPFAGL